jgi:signal transduction histidine kinase
MGRDYDLTVDVEADGAVPVPERNLRVLLFRLVRELLFNVVKHAGVDAATVRATRTDRSVRIVVADEGRGFDPDVLDVSDADGLGLASVHERLDGIGGQLDVDAAPGEGTTVTIRAPLSSKTMIWPTPDVPPSELG